MFLSLPSAASRAPDHAAQAHDCGPAPVKQWKRRLSAPEYAKSALIIAASLTLGLGCSAEVAQFDDAALATSTHAVLKVQHTEAGDGLTRGDALAGFVQIPAGADVQAILNLAGLAQELPEPGTCAEEAALFDAANAALSQAELLEADDVELSTTAGAHDLAPHAFPTVADLLRGVVYTSRDQSAADLPAETLYTLEGSAIGGKAQSLESSQMSPPMPALVLVNQTPFEQVSELAPTRFLDFSWSPTDQKGDRIVVSIQGEESTWLCTFADSEAFGSVPLITESGDDLAQAGSSAVVSVHRVREVSKDIGGELAEVTVNFDFAIEGNWRFVLNPSQEAALPREGELPTLERVTPELASSTDAAPSSSAVTSPLPQ